MKYSNVCIESTGYALPANVVTSDMLEDAIAPTLKRLGMPKGQIQQLSGVRERRFWDPGTQPSAVAALAAERALEKAGLKPTDVQVLVNTSVSRDYLEPATAAVVAGTLGVGRDCLAFDVGNACIGFLNGLITVATMIEAGQIEVALVVCGETARETVERTLHRLAQPDSTMQTLRDSFATLTLGSGAVAFVVTSRARSTTRHRLNGAVWRTATEHHQLCRATEQSMVTDSQGLLQHGVQLVGETWPLACEELAWGPDSVDLFLCHQVSLTHNAAAFQRMEQPQEKALLSLPYLGNVGPASLPLTLALAEAQGQVKNGQELCFCGIGSGLGVIVMGVTW